MTRPFLGHWVSFALAFACNAPWSTPALAWGDEGHQAIALIARDHLTPAARKKVDALLAADTDSLTAHNIADAATWADRYRDSDSNGARKHTRSWHFVDIELAAPDLNRACFGHPGLPTGTPASSGPDKDCVIDKIEQFAAELAGPDTDPSERVVALKFLLHFVGDLHQPLHASDDNDRGGNDKRASATGVKAATLHHYWDTEFVDRLGSDPRRIAAALSAKIPDNAMQTWTRGTPSDWAMESFRVAKEDVYGQLPAPNARGGYRLPETYVAMAIRDVATQIEKAGVRLAFMLNRALGP